MAPVGSQNGSMGRAIMAPPWNHYYDFDLGVAKLELQFSYGSVWGLHGSTHTRVDPFLTMTPLLQVTYSSLDLCVDYILEKSFL